VLPTTSAKTVVATPSDAHLGGANIELTLSRGYVRLKPYEASFDILEIFVTSRHS